MTVIDRAVAAAPDPTPLDTAARDFLNTAADAVDDRFGAGYARDNPELLASLIQASAITHAVHAGQSAHGEAMGLAQRITAQVCETMLKLKPRLFG